MDLKAPITAQFELTQACNNRCEYCYNYWRYGNDINLESYQASHFLSLAHSLIDGEVFHVTLTGGEPFLRRDVLYPLIDEFEDSYVDVGINTNLTLFKDDDLSRVREHPKLLNILVSLPSPREGDYNKITQSSNYKHVISNLEKVCSLGMNVAISMVVDRHNLNQVYENGRFVFENFDIRSFFATPVSPCAEAGKFHKELMLEKEELKNVLKELVALEKEFKMRTDVLEPVPHCLIFHNYDFEKFLRRTCVAGTSTLTVGPSGEVRPCSHSSQVYGRFPEDTMEEVWSSMQDWRNREYIPEECKPCAAVYKCLGGCRTASLATGGSLKSPHYLMEAPLDLRKEPRSLPMPEETEILYLKGNLRFREESDGLFLLYSSPQNCLLVSKSQLDFVQLLKSRHEDGFTLAELRKEYNFDGEQAPFFKEMLKRELIVPRDKITQQTC